MQPESSHDKSPATGTAVLRIFLSWLFLGGLAGAVVGTFNGGGWVALFYVVAAVAASLCGAFSHAFLVHFRAFRASIALVQVLTIAGLALALLIGYLLLPGSVTPFTNYPAGLVVGFVLIYVGPGLLCASLLLNAFLTPRDA